MMKRIIMCLLLSLSIMMQMCLVNAEDFVLTEEDQTAEGDLNETWNADIILSDELDEADYATVLPDESNIDWTIPENPQTAEAIPDDTLLPAEENNTEIEIISMDATNITDDISDESTPAAIQDESVQENENDFLYRELSDGTIEITGYLQDKATDLTIPNQIGGKEVSRIGDDAFSGCLLDGTLTFPNSLKSIGARAFYDQVGIRDMTLPNSLIEIGDSAFGECGGLGFLMFNKKFALPDSLERIGRRAFYNCYYMNIDMTLPKSLKFIGDDAFTFCHRITGELTIPDSLTYIGENAFFDCREMSGKLSFPDSLTYIGKYAFAYCERLEGKEEILTLPESLTNIGENAFIGCTNFNVSVRIPESLLSVIEFARAFKNCPCSLLIGDRPVVFVGFIYYGMDDDGEGYDYADAINYHEEVVDYGTCVSEPPAPVLDGYQFGGWTDGDIDSKFRFDFKKPVTGTVCLTPAWEKITVPQQTETTQQSETTPQQPETTQSTTHSYGAYKVTKEPTVLAEGTETRSCSVCGAQESRAVAKLAPTIKLSATSIKLKVKQSTTKVTVSGLARGDAVASWKSSNSKIVTVNKKGKITAKSKKGKATITVTLKSGLSKKIKVTVQKDVVSCTKVTLNKKSITLRKGKTFTLKPTIKPITCVQKAKYTTSNKSVATVSSKGKITAKKKGSATITVTVGKKKVKCKVKVK